MNNKGTKIKGPSFMELSPLLAKMAEHQASDLYISVGAPPKIKVEGKARSLGNDIITPTQSRVLAYSIMTKEQQEEFEEMMELNIAVHLREAGRFRINVYRQRGDVALVARLIKDEIPQLDHLGLPPILKELIMEERGLVLLVGATGTGKSTTLASMIDYRNERRSGHILAVEDPVEFVHYHKKSLVSQREIGLDTHSYADALRNALREAPDVIMIGEIRDIETMKHAIAYAETGHLCLSTLHANNAYQAMDRILNFFPEMAHRQVLQDLSLHLKAIVSQRLAIGKDGKRIAAVEVMLNTPYIADLIDKGRIEKIRDAMTKAELRGCQTFDSALFQLVLDGKITESEALRHADSRNNLSLKLRFERNVNEQTSHKLQKEVTYDKYAPFHHYQTFRVRAVKITDSGEDAEGMLTSAIVGVMEEKGYKQENETPDIELQYSLGVKSGSMLELEPLNSIAKTLPEGLEGKMYSVLLIQIVVCDTNRPIWKLKASRVISDEPVTKNELMEEVRDIFSSLPGC